MRQIRSERIPFDKSLLMMIGVSHVPCDRNAHRARIILLNQCRAPCAPCAPCKYKVMYAHACTYAHAPARTHARPYLKWTWDTGHMGHAPPSCRGCSLQSSFDRQPRLLGLLVPTLLIAGEANEMKVFEATISALACGLDVVPCGQVCDRGEQTAFAILVMESGKNHCRVTNSALPALKLERSSLSTVLLLREFAQAIVVLPQCLVVAGKLQFWPLSTALIGSFPAGGPSRGSLSPCRNSRMKI